MNFPYQHIPQKMVSTEQLEWLKAQSDFRPPTSRGELREVILPYRDPQDAFVITPTNEFEKTVGRTVLLIAEEFITTNNGRRETFLRWIIKVNSVIL